MIQGFIKFLVGSLLITAVVLGVSFMSLQDAGAASPKEAACVGSGGKWTVTNAATDEGTCTTPGSNRTVGGTLQQVSDILIFVVGGVSVLMVIIGGLRYALAQGDSNATSSAKNTVLYAIVGIIVSLMAYGLVHFVILQLI